MDNILSGLFISKKNEINEIKIINKSKKINIFINS